LPPFLGDAGQQAFDNRKGITVGQRGMRRKKPVEQINSIDFRLVGDCFGQVGQPDQQQEDERNRCQQRVKGQGAGKERNVVFISGLQGTAQEAGG
jgi:hypothetical protein